MRDRNKIGQYLKGYGRKPEKSIRMCAKNAKKMSCERFWSKVNKTETCWLWTSVCVQSGYGRWFFSRRKVGAHRISAIIHGLLHDYDDKRYVLHKCDVRNCVNPDHLFVGTAKENTADMIRKGRARFIENLPNQKSRIAKCSTN